jgi:hypothetical protein
LDARVSSAASVFQRILADSFVDLPVLLQRVHDARPSKHLRGHCAVERGTHWLVRWLAPIASLPPTSDDTALSVSIDVDIGNVNIPGEIWTRDFNGHRMQSRLWKQGAFLAERLGPVTLLFALRVEQQRIEWRVGGAKYWRVPLPASWFSGACATEQIVDAHYSFDVRATLPVLGLLIRYRGWLVESKR